LNRGQDQIDRRKQSFDVTAENRAPQKDLLILSLGDGFAHFNDAGKDRSVQVFVRSKVLLVNGCRLHSAVRHPIGNGLAHVREPDIDHVRAKIGKNVRGSGASGLCLRFHVLVVPLWIKAYPQTADPAARSGSEIRHWLGRRRRVPRITSCNGGQNDPRIHGASLRPLRNNQD
jgi:hypothetical protein